MFFLPPALGAGITVYQHVQRGESHFYETSLKTGLQIFLSVPQRAACFLSQLCSPLAWLTSCFCDLLANALSWAPDSSRFSGHPQESSLRRLSSTGHFKPAFPHPFPLVEPCTFLLRYKLPGVERSRTRAYSLAQCLEHSRG